MSTLRVNTVQNAAGTGTPSAGQIGVGQTLQSVMGSRASGVTYTNNTGRTIYVAVTVEATASGATLTYTVAGVTSGNHVTNNQRGAVFFFVPNGSTYAVTAAAAITSWLELRT